MELNTQYPRAKVEFWSWILSTRSQKWSFGAGSAASEAKIGVLELEALRLRSKVEFWSRILSIQGESNWIGQNTQYPRRIQPDWGRILSIQGESNWIGQNTQYPRRIQPDWSRILSIQGESNWIGAGYSVSENKTKSDATEISVFESAHICGKIIYP